jgi:serine protease Do
MYEQKKSIYGTLIGICLLTACLQNAIATTASKDETQPLSKVKSENSRSEQVTKSVFGNWLNLGGKNSLGLPSLAPIVEKLSPSVVNISTSQTLMRRQFELPQFPEGSIIDHLFNNRLQKRTSLGSGFIIDPDGYIVTNNHVITDADEITVVLADDTELKARIIGRDHRTDLALLKVDAAYKLPAVEWGDSSGVRPGDWVIAIGNPFGLGGSVTAGIVSKHARDISRARAGGVTEYIDDFIQTDASINGGNSGGPLFDMNGRVIGINTAMLSADGTNIGISFSIPSTVAKPIVEQLKQYGRTKRGWIGVHILRVSSDVADNIGLGNPRGALVGRVTPEGPAAKAGLKTWDVIVKFGDSIIPDPRKLTRIVGDTPVGKKVDLVVWRNQKEETLELTVGQLEDPEDAGFSLANKRLPKQQVIESLGLIVAPLTSDIRAQLDIKQDIEGVLVLDIKTHDSAIAKQLRPDDIIVEIEHKPIKSVEDLKAVVDDAMSAKKKSVLVQFFRDDQPVFGALKLEGIHSGGSKDDNGSNNKPTSPPSEEAAKSIPHQPAGS